MVLFSFSSSSFIIIIIHSYSISAVRSSYLQSLRKRVLIREDLVLATDSFVLCPLVQGQQAPPFIPELLLEWRSFWQARVLLTSSPASRTGRKVSGKPVPSQTETLTPLARGPFVMEWYSLIRSCYLSMVFGCDEGGGQGDRKTEVTYGSIHISRLRLSPFLLLQKVRLFLLLTLFVALSTKQLLIHHRLLYQSSNRCYPLSIPH